MTNTYRIDFSGRFDFSVCIPKTINPTRSDHALVIITTPVYFQNRILQNVAMHWT